MRTRLLVVLALVLSTVFVTATPASAGGVATSVPRSTHTIVQWVSEDSGDPCGEGDWFYQTFRLAWDIWTFDDGLTVNKVTLTVYSEMETRYVTLGGRSIVGGNGTYNIPPNYEFTTAIKNVSWSKTYTIDRYFTWQNGRNVTFWLNTVRPCGGLVTTTFQLVKGF